MQRLQVEAIIHTNICRHLGAIFLSKDRNITPKTKHIHIAYHISQDYEEKVLVKFLCTPSEKMVVDSMTKPLDKIKFYKFMDSLGLVLEKVRDPDRNDILNS